MAELRSTRPGSRVAVLVKSERTAAQVRQVLCAPSLAALLEERYRA